MSNVLDDNKQQQILALGRIGWSLRRIEQALAVRRETVSSYLKAAGIPSVVVAGGANRKQNRPFQRRCPPTPGRQNRPPGRRCPPTRLLRSSRDGPRARARASHIARSSSRRSRVAATLLPSGKTLSTTTAFRRGMRVSAGSWWHSAAALLWTPASSSPPRPVKKAKSITATARWSATAARGSIGARASSF
jgi:hypothetical protein